MAPSGRMFRKFFFVWKRAFSLPAPLMHTGLKWSEPVKDAVSTILMYRDPLLWCWKYSSSILQQLSAQHSLLWGWNEPKNKVEPFPDISWCSYRQFLIIRTEIVRTQWKYIMFAENSNIQICTDWLAKGTFLHLASLDSQLLICRMQN